VLLVKEVKKDTVLFFCAGGGLFVALEDRSRGDGIEADIKKKVRGKAAG